ncbi:hypothetical protein HDU83_007577 [Entophlyctis luteolus]|nr:hypothetical protein HDU83_007577 [Entophlyctis luteolus]
MTNITQIPHKHHFKTYQNTFRNDVFLNAVTAPPFNFSSNDAMECLGGLLLAQLIVNVEKPLSVNIEKGPFVVSAKGSVVLRDVSGNRIDERPPQAVFSDRNTKLKTGIIYLDRDSSGTLSLCQPTMEVLFCCAIGEKVWQNFLRLWVDAIVIYLWQFPNLTRADPTSLLATETTSSSSNLAAVQGEEMYPLLVKDRIVRLKSYSHAFTGAAMVDWILRHSSVVTREEAVFVMDEFVNQGWIENVSDEVSRDSSRVIFRCTALGARTAGWDDVPTIGGFFARKKSEAVPTRLSTAFDAREANSPRLSELANEALNS